MHAVKFSQKNKDNFYKAVNFRIKNESKMFLKSATKKKIKKKRFMMIFLEIFLYYNYFINKDNSICFLLFYSSVCIIQHDFGIIYKFTLIFSQEDLQQSVCGCFLFTILI